MTSLSRIAVALALTLAPLGCSYAGTRPANDQVALASADARLHGAWKLLGFRPERPLDPMTQMFLQAQFNVLTVRFDRGRFLAEAPGVRVDRGYRITEVEGDRVKLTSYDEQGVPYDAVCTFTQPDTLEVSSWTEPWRGIATLHRLDGLSGALASPVKLASSPPAP